MPRYLGTMASQNLPGFAVLRASGYQPPTQPILAVTGAASLFRRDLRFRRRHQPPQVAG